MNMMAKPAAMYKPVELKIPVKLMPILEPKRFKIMHGGRGGGKSHTVAQVLVMLSSMKKLRILCVREIQKSIAQSSMQVIKDYIERLGLSAYFEVLKTEIKCVTTGSTFAFIGLQDHTADSIKSFEGVDIVWAEEASKISTNSWNILIPTIVRKEGAEIWATFNSDQEDDYVYSRFVKGSDQDAWVCQINWRDNPWFSTAMNSERLKLKALNDDLYQHVWEGKCRSIAGLLFKRHWFKRYDLGNQPARLNKYVASDYAGGPDKNNPDREPDWTEHGCAGLDENGDLWFVDWWSGQEHPGTWISAFIAILKRNKPVNIAFEEKGVILRSVDAAISTAMREKDCHVLRTELASAGNKVTRAYGFAARASEGTVWIPNTDWGDRLINQLCAFTGEDGKVDDMVDVCSLLARGLDDMTNARPEPLKRPKQAEPFTEDWFAKKDRDLAREQTDRKRNFL